MVPIIKTTILGPYLSETWPPMIENTPVNRRYKEKMLEVVALLQANSFCKDLKKTPNE
jgi:hypothetical protein